MTNVTDTFYVGFNIVSLKSLNDLYKSKILSEFCYKIYVSLTVLINPVLK